ncbi:MAG: transcription termination/antitermination protein NusG, partial [Eubacterium sp.]|nr:transcription termination/antitermination protein NusG [Eubacterium sp.]
PEGKPVPLTEDEIKRALGNEIVEVEVAYEVGDLVNVIDGPLEGFSGTVESIDVPNNSVQVIVSMFGRDTAVDFELDQLEKVSD